MGFFYAVCKCGKTYSWGSFNYATIARGKQCEDCWKKYAQKESTMTTIKTILALSLLFGLIGCSDLQVKHTNDVIVKLKADAAHVIVTGCANAPQVQVLVAMIMEFLPEGTDKDKLLNGITVANANIAAICAKVQTPAVRAVPVTP